MNKYKHVWFGKLVLNISVNKYIKYLSLRIEMENTKWIWNAASILNTLYHCIWFRYILGLFTYVSTTSTVKKKYLRQTINKMCWDVIYYYLHNDIGKGLRIYYCTNDVFTSIYNTRFSFHIVLQFISFFYLFSPRDNNFHPLLLRNDVL